MAWPQVCTPILRSRRLRFLSLAGVVLLIIGIIVAAVLATRDSSSADLSATGTQSSIALPFNATYMLADPVPPTSSDLSFSAADRARIARDFEANLNLSVQNILEIRSIILTTGTGNVSLSRRKRQVQCDQDVGGKTGPALTFDFNLINSTNFSCMTQACLYEKTAEVHQQIQSSPALSIGLRGKQTALLLCSLDELPLKASDSRPEAPRPGPKTTTKRTVTTPVPTRAPTTTARSTKAPTTTTGSTRAPTTTPGSTGTPTTTAGATSAPTTTTGSTRAPATTTGGTSAPTRTPGSTTAPSTTEVSTGTSKTTTMTATMAASNTFTTGTTRSATTTPGSTTVPTTTTTTATVGASNTSTAETTIVTSVSTVTTTVLSTASSNSTLNGTTRDVDVCIRKLPIIQETAPPYGMSLTSTLFYQDEHILVVVGASKFETTLDMQTGQRQIIINGVMVYNNCQRTLDASIPMIASPSYSS